MSMTPLEELRHSASHVLATALLRLFPDAKLDIGPPTDTGFYYDIDLDHKLTAEDLAKIEAEMKKIADENQPLPPQGGLPRGGRRDHQGPRPGALQAGPPRRHPRGREDLLLPPTASSPTSAPAPTSATRRKLKAFKLLSIAGAYHRGDEKNKQLQRIYGTAFPTKEELAALPRAAGAGQGPRPPQARQGPEAFPSSTRTSARASSSGRPNGSIIRQELQNFISDELRKQGYSQVFTPHIGKLELYKTSGHFPYYKDSQFPPVVENESLAQIAPRRLLLRRDDGPPRGRLRPPRRQAQRAHRPGNHHRRTASSPTTSCSTASC